MSVYGNYHGLLLKIKEKPKKNCFCVSAKTVSGQIPNCDCPNPQFFQETKKLCL